MNKIIFTCNEFPNYGGAATNTYALIKFFREMNFEAYGIYFNDLNVNVDPDKIGGIIKLPVNINANNVNKCRDMVEKMIKGTPKITFNKNYLVLLLTKSLFPKSKNIYLAGGIPHFSEGDGLIDLHNYLRSNGKIHIHNKDHEAFKQSDLIIANSHLTLKVMNKIYPEFKHKIYNNPMDTTKCITALINEPNNNIKLDKKWDFIIIASNLKRRTKNNQFLIDLLKKPFFDKYSKIIIGIGSEMFHKIKNSTVFSLLSHDEVIEKLKQSKVLLFPSLFDSNPNTVREAIFSKCLVLTTNCIGFYDRFPDISICTSFHHNEWIKKSLHLVNNYKDIINNYHIDFSLPEDFDDFVYNIIEN